MKVAVVGGGVAGMSTALALAERGHDVVVLEAAARAGGKVQSIVDGEWTVERGPAMLLDNEPATWALFKRLGLEASVLPASPAAKLRYVLRDGALQLLPSSPPGLVRTRLIHFGEKLRLLAEPFMPRGHGDESVADFTRRRLGASLAETFVEAAQGGIYAGDWTKLSMQSAFPKLATLEAEHGSLLRGMIASMRQRRKQGGARPPAPSMMTLSGGLGTLSAALSKALGERLRVGAEVRALEAHGTGWRVLAGGAPLEVERVVLALPPRQSAQLTRAGDAAVADAFAAIPVNAVAAVSLGYARADVGHSVDGVGCLFPRNQHERLLGVLWMSSTFPAQAPRDHVLLRCIVGGAHDPAAVQLDDAALLALCQASLARHLGVRGAPRYHHLERWPEAIPQYELGHQQRVEVIEARGRARGLWATGASLRGVGVNDVVRAGAALADVFGA